MHGIEERLFHTCASSLLLGKDCGRIQNDGLLDESCFRTNKLKQNTRPLCHLEKTEAWNGWCFKGVWVSCLRYRVEAVFSLHATKTRFHHHGEKCRSSSLRSFTVDISSRLRNSRVFEGSFVQLK